jgi:lysophospholipase L1-like esterase
MRYGFAVVPVLTLVFAAACATGSDSLGGPSPALRATPDPACADANLRAPQLDPDAPLYIALGDSLSAGVGASDFMNTAFVPLVHKGLAPGTQLWNLGHSGDTSADLLDHGHVAAAAFEIACRNRDAGPENDVTLVTLVIGGNDLLRLYYDYVLPGTCPNVQEGLQKPECVNALRHTLALFGPNLAMAVDGLQEAGPDVRIVLMTIYNPFSGGGLQVFEELGELSMEGLADTAFPEGINSLIRAEAEESGIVLVDLYPLFKGKGGEYIADDFIHPNDAGYRAMADAVLEAISD